MSKLLFRVQVNGNAATVTERHGRLLSGMRGVTIALSYSADWAQMRKTVVFRNGGVTKDIVDAAEVVEIPPEILASVGTLEVGVYGWNQDQGIAMPTAWATLDLIRAGADPSGDSTSTTPTAVWQQVLDMLGKLDQLETVTRENLVGAINEALRKATDVSEEELLALIQPVAEDAAAAKKAWEASLRQLSLCPEGASSNYYVFTPGWKRILVSMRHNSGIVNLSLDLNSKTYGRSMQSVTFGYSCAVVDHPSSKHNERRAGMPGAEPKLWQITNHCFGEDPSQSSLSRLFRIDKVRIAYPISWEETEDADTGDRYSNPINTYLDVHVAGEIPPTGVQLLTNIVAKSYNNGTMAVAEETPVQASEDGYVLGVDGVKCHTHELQLWEEGMLNTPGESRFEGLAANRVDALIDKAVEVVPGERIGTERAEVKSLKLRFAYGAGNGADPTALSLRASYKENLLPGAFADGSSHAPGLDGGVSTTLMANGIYRINGTSTKVTCRKLWEYKKGDCPFKLVKGHTYYVYGAYLQVRSSLAEESWKYVRGFDTATYQPKLVTYTPDEDKYVFFVGFYWRAGTSFDNVLVYPQMTEDKSLIVGDLGEDGNAYNAWLEYCNTQSAYGLPPLSYMAYLTRYVLPDVMYASQTLSLTSSAAALTDALISVEDGYVEADGETVDACPLLPLYRRMLERADYIFAWQGGQDGSLCDSIEMVCTERVPVVVDGKLSKEMTGDMDAALDAILAIQNELKGGDGA